MTDILESDLLSDLYQRAMMEANVAIPKAETAVFGVSVCKLPERRNFFVAAEQEQVLDFLERLYVPSEELDWLKQNGRFGQPLLDYLADFSFARDVHPTPQGTVFFPDGPIIAVAVPLPEAQHVETRIIDLLRFQAIISSKAARARPNSLVLRIDTDDTQAVARNVAALAPRLGADGITVQAVWLDRGDLRAMAKSVRAILDTAGLRSAHIFARGGLNEDKIGTLAVSGPPIDSVDDGSCMTTSSDAPVLDCADTLQDYAGLARQKLPTVKATWPGRKRVWRGHDNRDQAQREVMSTHVGNLSGTPPIRQVLKKGVRTGTIRTLDDIKAHAAQELQLMPGAAGAGERRGVSGCRRQSAFEAGAGDEHSDEKPNPTSMRGNQRCAENNDMGRSHTAQHWPSGVVSSASMTWRSECRPQTPGV